MLPSDLKLETFIGCGGQLRYRCPFYPDCGYDTYSTELLLKHTHEHAGPEDATVQEPTLFDDPKASERRGRVIIPGRHEI